MFSQELFYVAKVHKMVSWPTDEQMSLNQNLSVILVFLDASVP